ncbi:unnamed protein product [Hermetia illucens]|uniref:MADF domain-containing protein n=2 Tax=Hermetia illucens TaxID=343691 RepID=A0A7R8UYQ1_HERIL|nr:unnamed protein product [Hermetia illucens]
MEDSLIKLVKSREVLYNKAHQRYFDAKYKNAIWREIGDTLNRSRDEVKKRWKHLRGTFVKKMKISPTGSSPECQSWPYFESMLFLKAFLRPRRTQCSEISFDADTLISPVKYEEEILEKNDSVSSIYAEMIAPPPPKKKSTMSTTLAAIENAALAIKEKVQTEDNDSIIYKTIGVLMGEIPAHNRDAAREELFNFVFELKRKYS